MTYQKEKENKSGIYKLFERGWNLDSRYTAEKQAKHKNIEL